MSQQIDILPSHQIDAKKWNNCIARAENGLIYSRYEYLQFICDNWDGVIVRDYEAVMALPWRMKLSIKYYYEPAFIQQLGLVGERDDLNLIEQLLSVARYGDILFNYKNETFASETGAKKRTNLVLDLSPGISEIRSCYKKDLTLNLRKAHKSGLAVVIDLSINEAVEHYQKLYKERFKHIKQNDYINFIELAHELAKNEMCFTRKICNRSGELMAIGLFLKDEKRIYNIMNTTTEKGRQVEANHFLLDSVIEEYSGKQLLFDFEGSDLPGVKSFYLKFGAIDQPYYHWHFNKLPFPLRLLKR
jgi:hypothetical protein